MEQLPQRKVAGGAVTGYYACVGGRVGDKGAGVHSRAQHAQRCKLDVGVADANLLAE